MNRREGLTSTLIKLGEPATYHPSLAKMLGGVQAAVFLGMLLRWAGRGARRDGYIWKSMQEISNETALTRREQDAARGILRRLGIVKEKRASIPPRVHFLLDTKRLDDLWSAWDGAAEEEEERPSDEEMMDRYKQYEAQQWREFQRDPMAKKPQIQIMSFQRWLLEAEAEERHKKWEARQLLRDEILRARKAPRRTRGEAS